MGRGPSQEEGMLKTRTSGGKGRGCWRKGSDLLPPPSVGEGRGTGMRWEARGMGPRHVGKRTTGERER